MTANSLYKFSIILSLIIFLTKLELYPVQIITKLYFEILLLNFTLFNNPELLIDETILFFFNDIDLIFLILFNIKLIIFEFSKI